MKQLAGLDASFLYLETPQMPMHVGALHLLELPADYDGDYVEDLREHMRARMPLLPALRRKLVAMPLGLSNPGWVDADPDLEAHIVEIALPKLGGQGSGMGELEAQVGALHPVLLDRSRPLWKFHVFTGLEPGPEGQVRVGLYTQLHHAAVDGQAAVALAQVILDLSPEPRTIEFTPHARQEARPTRHRRHAARRRLAAVAADRQARPRPAQRGGHPRSHGRGLWRRNSGRFGSGQLCHQAAHAADGCGRRRRRPSCAARRPCPASGRRRARAST